MEELRGLKRDAAFTSSPPTEFVTYDRSKTPVLFPIDPRPREPGEPEAGLILQRSVGTTMTRNLTKPDRMSVIG